MLSRRDRMLSCFGVAPRYLRSLGVKHSERFMAIDAERQAIRERIKLLANDRLQVKALRGKE